MNISLLSSWLKEKPRKNQHKRELKLTFSELHVTVLTTVLFAL
jgi:hypothetical protein